MVNYPVTEKKIFVKPIKKDEGKFVTLFKHQACQEHTGKTWYSWLYAFITLNLEGF
jgi:hypothetical protein